MTTTKSKEMKLTITLKDYRAKEIVKALPIKQRDEHPTLILETYNNGKITLIYVLLT